MEKINIEKDTKENKYYRKVINTTKNIQVVLMSILPLQEIGLEKHKKTTQFVKIEKGKGVAYICSKRYNLKAGDSIVIPPDKFHNIINTGNTNLKLYSIYSPPIHKCDDKAKLKI